MQIPGLQRVLSRKKEAMKNADVRPDNSTVLQTPLKKVGAGANHDGIRLEDCQPPSTRVAHIYELLELILLELPVRDLLFAQLVCRSFKATIDQSEPIQERLFFRPQIKSAARDGTRVNDLLLDSRVFSDRIIMKVPGANRLHVLLDPSATTKPTHLFLKSREMRKSVFRSRDDGEKPVITTFIQLNFRIGRYCSTWPFTKGCRVCNSPPLRDGSWQRMYLTQPPIRICCANGEGHRTWKNLNLDYPRETVGTWLTTGEDFQEPVRAKSDAQKHAQDIVVLTGQAM